MPGPDLVVDGIGLACVTLILKLRAELRNQPPGALVHVLSTDPAAALDLPAWCHMTGHSYLGGLPGTKPTVHALRVAGQPSATDPRHPWRAAAAPAPGDTRHRALRGLGTPRTVPDP